MDIGESVHRVLLQSNTLADLFYLVFLERFPEVQVQFHGVNMKQQTVLLTMALLVVERHAKHAYPATEAYLRLLGQQHDLRDIPRELYPKWREAMLGTLERFHGKDWDEPLANEWRVALDSAIGVMLSGYK